MQWVEFVHAVLSYSDKSWLKNAEAGVAFAPPPVELANPHFHGTMAAAGTSRSPIEC
jgi:hypothetical protein